MKAVIKSFNRETVYPGMVYGHLSFDYELTDPTPLIKQIEHKLGKSFSQEDLFNNTFKVKDHASTKGAGEISIGIIDEIFIDEDTGESFIRTIGDTCTELTYLDSSPFIHFELEDSDIKTFNWKKVALTIAGIGLVYIGLSKLSS